MIFTDRSWVEIDLSAFHHNLKELKRFLSPDCGFMQIVKADAYGHGAYEIANAALEEGAALLGVANYEEGKLLRLQGITAPILILSPSLPSEIDGILDYSLTTSISEPQFARELAKAAASQGITAKVHIKIDTGMHRSGCSPEQFASLYDSVSSLDSLEIEGIFSHFAASEQDRIYSSIQEQAFGEIDLPAEPRFRHIANSSAVVNGFGLGSNLVRLGILSYGIYTHPDQQGKLDLKPVMTFKSTLSLIKEIKQGEGLGYNLTWHSPRDGRYGIIPVGYADGYDYLLGNKALVSTALGLSPVIGKVSMDMITIDVTDMPGLKAGDELVLLGGDNPETRAENIASLYRGSAYELLCQVGRRARRYYFKDSKLFSSAPLSRRDFVPADFSDSKLSSIIEAAVSQRLGSDEIGALVYQEMLARLFFDKDQNIHYRKGFHHTIKLIDGDDPAFFEVQTTLSYRKVLDNDYFIVACAQSEEVLQAYFKRSDVEYRWLMDDNFELTPQRFSISSIKVADIELETAVQQSLDCLEIRCSHPSLNNLVGSEQDFVINTRTYYPRNSHQLSVFITEPTQGVSISLESPDCIQNVECIPIYSGQNKYPAISRKSSRILVETDPQQWIFPMSGVVFAY